MVKLIKPGETTVVTKNGEAKIKITLDLNINLNSSGITIEEAKATAIEGDKVDWSIGDFSPKKKVKFGKSVQE